MRASEAVLPHVLPVLVRPGITVLAFAGAFETNPKPCEATKTTPFRNEPVGLELFPEVPSPVAEAGPLLSGPSE